MDQRCSLMSLVAALGLLALGSWVGFVVHVPHPAPHVETPGAAGVAKPPERKPSTDMDDDDLDKSGPEVVHDPLVITPTDWTASGRFARPVPRPLDAHGGQAYPPTAPLTEVLRRWNPDNVTVPTPFVETLQVFNYSDAAERAMAETYRDAELPFKVYGVPNVDAVRAKWTDAYLIDAMDARRTGFGGKSRFSAALSKRARVQYKVEQSENNHFMYWQHKAGASSLYRDWTPPTRIVTGVSFSTWLEWARTADAEEAGPETEHHYLMLGTPPLSSIASRRGASVAKKKKKRGSDRRRAEDGGADREEESEDPKAGLHFVNADLDVFTPESENFFVTNAAANKGIQCRFGMRGVIAEAHYDGGRNMVAMLKGAKRYVLTPPASCDGLNIIKDRRHPSFRHSTTDWSHQTQADAQLDTARAVDTVVREGEVLYIPSYWIHYIVSLRYSIQCNTRSGAPPNGEGEEDVKNCVGEENTRQNLDRGAFSGVSGAKKRLRRRDKDKKRRRKASSEED